MTNKTQCPNCNGFRVDPASVQIYDDKGNPIKTECEPKGFWCWDCRLFLDYFEVVK